jgi:hypothetical protein
MRKTLRILAVAGLTCVAALGVALVSPASASSFAATAIEYGLIAALIAV